MPYRAPVEEYKFLFDHVIGLADVTATDRFADATPEMTAAILSEAARLCEEVLYPLQRPGDLNPARLENGIVRTAPGFADGYRAIAAGGWVAISAHPDHGGMGLPMALTTAVNEMMSQACLPLQLAPLLTQGQIEALEHHASDAIKDLYLPKLVSGDWTGTMNLTESQAGSDVGAVRTRAEHRGDGTYAITGQKIYISWGDNDFTRNVCHLVLARLPDTSSSGACAVLDFQIRRMVHLLSELADALLAANFGPAVRLQNYKQLRKAAHAMADQDAGFSVERLALTRSGSTIATLKAEHASSGEVMAVYKEGQSRKVIEELSGVDQWNQVYPKVAPTVLSQHVEKGDKLSSMVIEHLPGHTLESLLLNHQWDAARQLVDKLQKTLRKIWKSSRTAEMAQPGYMQQLRKRLPESRHTHPGLFGEVQRICGLTRPSLDQLIDHVGKLEKQLRAPFSVLIHGDFNVDNIIYDDLKERIYFIDLHRASYSDYVQDLSVLMVSIYRLPILDAAPRAELMGLIHQLYHFARRFAKSQQDASFDARLAIALGRSFATSTRFIYDRQFASALALRASYLLEAITLVNPQALDTYRLPFEDIFHD